MILSAVGHADSEERRKRRSVPYTPEEEAEADAPYEAAELARATFDAEQSGRDETKEQIDALIEMGDALGAMMLLRELMG